MLLEARMGSWQLKIETEAEVPALAAAAASAVTSSEQKKEEEGG